MLTSLPTTLAAKPRPRGFTLLELTVAAFVLSLVLGLAVPQLQGLLTQTPQQELSHLARTLRQLRNDAILQNRTYWLIFDLAQQQVRVEEEQSGQRQAFAEDHPQRSLRPHQLPEDWEIANVLLAQQQPELMQPTQVEVLIDNSGFVTPFRYQFRQRNDPDRFWEIETNGLLGRVVLRSPESES